ncbi:hypothetical protein IV53_GL000180 [Ligilactobacillus ceti DSM 22408]|uniref:Membrane-bound metal-dependent hydrolase n=2 Tax=Ligilactobacillus TaxID=2767887 RepID=A0A0R2KIR1_9LACO|nr:hypothetical protein IV53_GL000180 [Ligilactobacillus ceti DSM 22408]
MMECKTHVATTLALGLPLLAVSHEVTAVNVGILALGSLLPDIDHPSSYLGRRHKIMSSVTNKTLGHRGATHSIFGLVLFFVISTFIQHHYLSGDTLNLPFWLSFGYLCHLLEDSLSQQGVRWCWPLFRKKRKKRKKVFYYRTSTMSEYLILVLVLAILIFEISLYLKGDFNYPHMQEVVTWCQQKVHNLQSIINNIT